MTETTEENTQTKLKTMATQSRQRLIELGSNWAKLGIDRTSGALEAASKSLEATRSTLAQWKESLPSPAPESEVKAEKAPASKKASANAS